MGNDINSLIANYLNKNKDVSLSQVNKSFDDIKEKLSTDDSQTLFDSAKGASGEEFLELMNVSSSDVDNKSYQDSVNILFDILDANSDGQLSSDEMDILKLSSENKINDDGILQALNYDEKIVQHNLDSLESTDEKAVSKSELPSGYKISEDGTILDSTGKEIGRVEISYADATGDGVTDKITQYFLYTESKETPNIPDGWTQNDDGTLTDENGQKLSPVPAEDIDNGNYEIKDGKIYDKSGKEVGRVIVSEADLKGNDNVNETLELYYLYVFDEQSVSNNNSTSVQSSSSSETPQSQNGINNQNESEAQEINKPVISDEVAIIFADELYQATAGRNGTDVKQFESVLNNSDLTSEDFVKIISAYNEKYGSFIQDVEDDFSGKKQDTIMNKIADELIEAAKNGNDEAITLLCKEFYNSTAGMNGTVDEFIERIMSTAGDDVLAKIIENYSEVNEGSDIFLDVSNDFSGKNKNNFISKLNKVAAINGKTEDGVISDNIALTFARQLYEATENHSGKDKKTVSSILGNADLSSADISKIVSKYIEKYGSLVEAIESDFAGENNKKYQKIVADALIEQATAGDDKAIELLCKEFYNATEAKNTTSDPFIQEIFDKAGYDVLAKLALMYSDVNEGSDIFNAIKGDFSGDKEDNYINKLNEALAKYR